MPTSEAPVIAIYDKAGELRDFLRAPQSVRVVPRWLEPGEATLNVQIGDYRSGLLREPGARVKIELRGEHVLGGPVTGWEMTGPGQDSGWSFTVTDDSAILDRVMCWPDPTKDLAAQPGTDAQAAMSGPLESVVKTLIRLNAPKVGIPLSIVEDRQRGPRVTVKPRWQSVSEVTSTLLRDAGMGATVVWEPATNRLRIDVVEQKPYGIQLSPETRTITAWRISSQAPVATRVWMGQADGTAYTSATNGPAETDWGVFLTGGTFRAADSADEAATAGTEALNEGGPKSGLSVSLSESGLVRYGGPTGLHVGDTATIRVGDVTITDVVREAVIEWKAGGALTVTPAVGAWDQSPTAALTSAVRRVAATVRKQLNR